LLDLVVFLPVIYKPFAYVFMASSITGKMRLDQFLSFYSKSLIFKIVRLGEPVYKWQNFIALITV